MLVFWFLVCALGYMGLTTTTTPTAQEAKGIVIENECELRQEKQALLDTMKYTESVSFAFDLMENSTITEIDNSLDEAISKADNCTWVFYHHINIEQIATDYLETRWYYIYK